MSVCFRAAEVGVIYESQCRLCTVDGAPGLPRRRVRARTKSGGRRRASRRTSSAAEDLGQRRHVLRADAELSRRQQEGVRVLLPELTPPVIQREDAALQLGQLSTGGVAVLRAGVPLHPLGHPGVHSRGAAPRAGRPRGVRHADVLGRRVPPGAPEAELSGGDQHGLADGLPGVAEVRVDAVDGRFRDALSGPPPRLLLQRPQVPLGAENVYSARRWEGLAGG